LEELSNTIFNVNEPRKQTCIDSFFIWLWETYTFSNELLCTKNGFEMNFYANFC
jgi:hypothetical protein